MVAGEVGKHGGAEPRAFESWNLPLLELEQFRALDADRQYPVSLAQARYLLGFSLLAPSSHNTVPQAYRLDLPHSRIELWLQRGRVLPASDPTGQQALISLGCAAENLVLAAAQYGIGCSWQADADLDWSRVTPSPSPLPVRVGHFLLSPSSPVPDAQSRRLALLAMLERRTVRAEFDPAERMPPRLRASLESVLGPGGPIRLSWFESSTEKFAWGKLDELASKHKLEERAFQRELGEWLLPNEDDRSPRGMRGREFGFDDVLTRELSAQLRGQAPMAVDQLAFMARAGRVGLCSASVVCVLSSHDQSADTALAVGRAFQRCALLARAEDFACAVHTAVCEVPHARAMSQATLTPEGMTPRMIFRLGKPRKTTDATRTPSSRPLLDDLLLG